MHAAVRACPGYDRHEAPSILMDGSSLALDTEHGKAVAAQLTRRQDTLGEAIEAAGVALSAANLDRGIRRQARGACEDYFYTRLGLGPDFELPRMRDIPPGLEPLPDDMIKQLEDLIELVVDGEYEDLRELSDRRLDVEDMRRRVEDDCPEALVLPPREIYRVEAITKSDDPSVPAGGTSSSCGPKRAPRPSTSRARPRSPAGATARRSTTSCPDERARRHRRRCRPRPRGRGWPADPRVRRLRVPVHAPRVPRDPARRGARRGALRVPPLPAHRHPSARAARLLPRPRRRRSRAATGTCTSGCSTARRRWRTMTCAAMRASSGSTSRASTPIASRPACSSGSAATCGAGSTPARCSGRRRSSSTAPSCATATTLDTLLAGAQAPT